jgi:hypothetical protein
VNVNVVTKDKAEELSASLPANPDYASQWDRQISDVIQRLDGAPLNIGRQAAVALPPVLCPPT